MRFSAARRAEPSHRTTDNMLFDSAVGISYVGE